MKLHVTVATALALSLAACSQPATEEAETETAAQALSLEALDAAVANEARPEQARELDASRKPAAVLAFLGLEEGDTAADLVSGGGYWAEILAKAVGPDGSVTAFEPEQFYNEEVWTALDEREPGIALERYRMEDFQSGEARFDFAVMNLVYHDLYWESEQYDVPRSEPQDYLASLYSIMKPGGIVGVIDHVGNEGDTRKTVEDFHRIDPAVVRADFEKAGFVLESESAMLANPEDGHDTSVFDPAIRGKTDRFIMKFVKPEA
ncbi:class I SAM-dependent methyltransferase [Qipengyuania vesicularis]|uniref:class I SAM-dependent methyltransferase n=1 Tax=Qipengyuania vesicularis TaxID=2867232 RepID=UPI001C8739E2|nr:methyltransferase domain-containing protein [Qipengyuania vesicularis]MBX7527388.1 methyltransferase domain-containing protein [Qipengyuania vesicularis]